jgi:hypothetical protein
MFETDTEKKLVAKDQTIFVPGGINRGIENISVAIFKVLVIKTIA